jgi:hypothetical protein
MDISNHQFELLPKQSDDEGRLSICQPTLSLKEGDDATDCFMITACLVALGVRSRDGEAIQAPVRRVGAIQGVVFGCL